MSIQQNDLTHEAKAMFDVDLFEDAAYAELRFAQSGAGYWALVWCGEELQLVQNVNGENDVHLTSPGVVSARYVFVLDDGLACYADNELLWRYAKVPCEADSQVTSLGDIETVAVYKRVISGDAARVIIDALETR